MGGNGKADPVSVDESLFVNYVLAAEHSI